MVFAGARTAAPKASPLTLQGGGPISPQTRGATSRPRHQARPAERGFLISRAPPRGRVSFLKWSPRPLRRYAGRSGSVQVATASQASERPAPIEAVPVARPGFRFAARAFAFCAFQLLPLEARP
jgi:hypothetical protein